MLRAADRTRAYERRLIAVADARFFPALQARFLTRDGRAAVSLRLSFAQRLVRAAERVLDEAAASVPCPAIYRLRTRTQAARGFRRRLRRAESVFSDQPEIWTRRERPPRAWAEGEPLPLPLDVPGVACAVAALAPDVVAALRRRPAAGAAEAACEALASMHASTRAADAGGWEALVQAIAILTPRRRTPLAPSAHDSGRSFGAALFESGVSELRLARLLTAPATRRRDLIASVCRQLRAASRNRFDLDALARLILDGAGAAAYRINLEYYGAAGVDQVRRTETASDG